MMRHILKIIPISKLEGAPQSSSTHASVSMTRGGLSGPVHFGAPSTSFNLPATISTRVQMLVPAKSIPPMQSSSGMGDFDESHNSQDERGEFEAATTSRQGSFYEGEVEPSRKKRFRS